MKPTLALALTLILFVCCGCGDSHESLADESVSTMKEMVAVLDGVKDEATAQSAKPKLKSLAERLNSINERMSKLGAPTEAQIKTMDAKAGKEMEEVQQKFVGHMFRIAGDPKIQAVLEDVGRSVGMTKDDK